MRYNLYKYLVPLGLFGYLLAYFGIFYYYIYSWCSMGLIQLAQVFTLGILFGLLGFIFILTPLAAFVIMLLLKIIFD